MTRPAPPTPALLDPEEFVPYFTWGEYLRLEPPAGARFEFEAGRLLVSPSGSAPHDLLIAVLLEFLAAYERRTGNRHCVSFPPHSFFMPPGERDYQPDVGIIPIAGRTGRSSAPPRARRTSRSRCSRRPPSGGIAG